MAVRRSPSAIARAAASSYRPCLTSPETSEAISSATFHGSRSGMSSPLLVVGSVGLDTVETSAGRREEILGGAASYFSVAASFFTPVRLTAVVGTDFPAAHTSLL